MDPMLVERQRWQTLLGVMSGLTGITLTLLTRTIVGLDWTDAALFGVPLGLAAAPLSFSAWYVCRATPLARTPVARALATACSAAAAMAVLWAGVGIGWWWLLGQTGLVTEGASKRALAALVFAVGVLAYLLALSVTYLIEALETSSEVGQRVLESRVAQRDAELSALRAQVDPHFLFNSLNSVVGLIGADPDRARAMCQMLGDFLRDSLALGSVDRISVAREVGLAAQYLRIEQVRFGARLGVVTTVAPDAADVPVPPLILQPLVENAVRHGIATRLEGGDVRIDARRVGSRLVLAVTNPREVDGSRPGTGLGLSIVRRRLHAGFGDDATLLLEPREGTFAATVTLPGVRAMEPVATGGEA